MKPRASGLLTFIGVGTAIIAGDGQPPLGKLLLVLVTVLVASAGANGLTNYLDRDIDARMQRTRHRALPSKSIEPATKVLALSTGLVIVGLALAWQLHPLSFIANVVGTLAAIVWRKRATCIFPQGMIASCAPVLMGWFAITPTFNWQILLLCALIVTWLPLHVWSIMIANRDDYIGAGLTYFPMSRETSQAVKVLPVLSLILGTAAITLYFTGGFSLFYLIVASLLSIIMAYASVRLVISGTSEDAWRLYKLSTFPYLSLIFLVMSLDSWLL